LESIEDVFDDIPDAVFASIPEVPIFAATSDQVSAAASEVQASAAETQFLATASQVKVPVTETTQNVVPDVSAAANEVPIAATGPRMMNGPRMLNGPRMMNGPSFTTAAKLKNKVQQVKKRTSDRLMKLKTKAITGPGATADAPMVLDESEEGVLTQEGTIDKEGVVLPHMRTLPTLVAEK
jgi:hypothetical protein